MEKSRLVCFVLFLLLLSYHAEGRTYGYRPRIRTKFGFQGNTFILPADSDNVELRDTGSLLDDTRHLNDDIKDAETLERNQRTYPDAADTDADI